MGSLPCFGQVCNAAQQTAMRLHTTTATYIALSGFGRTRQALQAAPAAKRWQLARREQLQTTSTRWRVYSSTGARIHIPLARSTEKPPGTPLERQACNLKSQAKSAAISCGCRICRSSPRHRCLERGAVGTPQTAYPRRARG